MPKVKVKIEFNERDLKELIADKYELDLSTTTISIYKYEAGSDPRETSYTTVIVEGEKIER